MRGISRSDSAKAVQVVLSATTTYGARGRLDVGQPLEHCVDVKS